MDIERERRFPSDALDLQFASEAGTAVRREPAPKGRRSTPNPTSTRPCIATAEQLHGKELSYNNILDLDSALNLAREFSQPAAVVVKHNNPCGAATAATLADAFRAAWDGDPQSAFGGILAFNRPVDADTAAALMDPKAKRFIECVIAPDYDPAALDALKKWKENVRLLKTGTLEGGPQGLDYRRVDGGLLVQTRDVGADDPAKWKVATKRQPTARRARRPLVRLAGLQARQESTRSCSRTDTRSRRRRGRADEPGRFGSDRRSARPASG